MRPLLLCLMSFPFRFYEVAEALAEPLSKLLLEADSLCMASVRFCVLCQHVHLHLCLSMHLHLFLYLCL